MQQPTIPGRRAGAPGAGSLPGRELVTDYITDHCTTIPTSEDGRAATARDPNQLDDRVAEVAAELDVTKVHTRKRSAGL